MLEGTVDSFSLIEQMHLADGTDFKLVGVRIVGAMPVTEFCRRR